MAEHKREIGQRLVYLGVLLDSQEWSRPLEPITAVSFLHLSSRLPCLGLEW
jgi:hypothetical protein